MASEDWGGVFPDNVDMIIVKLTRVGAQWGELEMECPRCHYKIRWDDYSRQIFYKVVQDGDQSETGYHVHSISVSDEILSTFVAARRDLAGVLGTIKEQVEKKVAEEMRPPDDKGITWIWGKIPDAFADFLRKMGLEVDEDE